MIRRRTLGEARQLMGVRAQSNDAERFVLMFGRMPAHDEAPALHRAGAFRLLLTGTPVAFDRFAAAWRAACVDLLDAWIRERPGTRPHGWWVVEAVEHGPRADDETEAQYLRRHGLLRDEEVAHLTRAWSKS